MNKNIATIQSGLAGLGHDPGAPDGIFGPRTRAAAQAWLDAGGAVARPIRVEAAVAPTSATIWQSAARYPVHEIIIHCAATKPEWMASAGITAQVAEIRRWHKAQGWADIGYHWVIGRDGAIRAGRRETMIGAHVAGHNTGTIGICLIGGFGSASTDRFSDHFTTAQDVSLRQLILGISLRTRIDRISGHNEYAAKACPGFTVGQWLAEKA